MAKIAKSIRIEDDLHNRAKSFGAARGLGVEESYEKALEAWISPPQTGTALSVEEAEYFDLLLRVLRFGNEGVIAGVTAILDSQKGTLPELGPHKRSKTA